MTVPIHRVLHGAEVGDAFRGLGMPGHTGPQAQLPGMSRAFADDNVLSNVQGGINPFITGLLRGFPRPTLTPGQVLFRMVVAPTITFQHRRFGRERFFVQDTRRAMNAPFRFKLRTYDRVALTLERRGFVSVADRDEIANALAVGGPGGGFIDDFTFRKAIEARDEVENDIENTRATIVTTVGNYTLTPTTLAGGQEWNDATNGDSRATIQAAAWQLARANNVQPGQIGVMLTHQSLEAVQSDPVLIAALSSAAEGPGGSATGRTATMADLQQYYGVGEVRVADWFFTADGDSFVSGYGDIAVLYLLRGPAQDLDLLETTNDAVVDFSWNAAGGLALNPVFVDVSVEGMATTWLYPFETYITPTLVNPDAWFLIQNTSNITP